MSFPRPMKLSAAALALVAPLDLVACGSDESEDTSAPTTSAVTSTVEATSEKETSSVETTTSEAEETSEAPESDVSAPAETGEPEGGEGIDPEAAGAADAVSGGPLDAEELQPVEGGQPADEATRKQISALVNGWYEVEDMRAYMRYIPEHTCAQVLEQNPDVNNVDYSVFPQIPMNQVNDKWNTAGVQSIDDLVVNGDVASATVTVNTGEGVDTSVMRFKNEGGNWLFCN